MPVHCALTGLVHGPDLHLIMAAWGRQETARRLEKSLTGLTECGNTCDVYIIPAILNRKGLNRKGDDKVKRSKSILVRLTEQEQKELLQAVEDWNQSRESWQDKISTSKYIRDAIEEKIYRDKRKRRKIT